MWYRILFGKSCAALPAAVIIAYEVCRQALKADWDLFLFVLPVLVLALSIWSHRALQEFAKQSGTSSFYVLKAEVDDARFFDQTIRVMSIIGVMAGSRYLFLDSPLVVPEEKGGMSAAARLAWAMGIEAFFMIAFMAICARSLAFHASIFYAMGGAQIWKMELAAVTEPQAVALNRPGDAAAITVGAISATVIGDGTRMLQRSDQIRLREVMPFQVYTFFVRDQDEQD